MSLQQIILHPTVDQSLKYAATTVGRDKVYRAVQYFSRFLVWYFKRRQGGLLGLLRDKSAIQRFSNLKSALGLSRKLMRLGKPMEHLQHATRAFFNEVDEFSRITIIGRQIGYAIYLFYDTFSWAHGAGVYKFKSIKRINENAYRFWLIGLIFSIIHGLYKLRILQDGSLSRARIVETGEHSNVRSEAAALRRERKSAVRQLIQDLLDLTIPATALGYLRFEDGFVGLAGFTTSIMGAQSQWKKVNGPK